MVKKSTYFILFLPFFIFLPCYAFFSLHLFNAWSIGIFYIGNLLIGAILFNLNARKEYQLQLKFQALQEKINLQQDENGKELSNNAAFQEKISRYSKLKNIIEEINKGLALESIADNLVTLAFSAIADNRGACILYLVDHKTHKLSLFKTRKEDKRLIVKAKEGDIFDSWVLRHTSPLLIEDIKNDFRFDMEKVTAQEERPVASLISAPFISEHKFLGLLRLDSTQTASYTQEDLRLLVTICEVGAVALENGELFLSTEDLAIHDGLTALYRKNYFLERLKEECRRSSRQNKEFSLLMLDIDYFKKYNDKFGHMAGDIVLKSLSQDMIDFFQNTSAVISRFGGEEFCIILPGTAKKQAVSLAEELRKKVKENEIQLRNQKASITVSIGVASFPIDARDETELIMKVDKSMYEAKEGGRDRVMAWK